MLLDLTSLPRTADSLGARVWTKPRWSDPFTLQPHLLVTQTASTLAPEISTAALEYRYGHGIVPGTSYLGTYVPITAWGYFVLIEWFTAAERRWWLGYAGKPVTTQTRADAGDIAAAGIQRIPCYGLERAFQLARIESTVHADPAGDADFVRHATGSTFNDTSVGNRHDSDDFDVFALPRAATVHRWTSRQIVRHLLTYHLPTPTGEATGLPWTIGDLSPVPDWDAPTLETDGRTLADCLNELLGRERLLGWHLVPTIEPESPPVVSELTFTPISRSARPIQLPSIGTLPANPNVHHLVAATDPLTDASTSEDDSDLVDQVIVQGPREIGVCTLRWGNDLEKGWTTPQESKYNDGARPEPTWNALPQFKQRLANERIRGNASLEDVFSSLKIPADWNGKADGSDPVFVPDRNDEDEEVAYSPYVGNVEILDQLPLFVEVEYEGDATGIDEAAGRRYRPPLFMIERPGTGIYDLVDKLGDLHAGVSPEVAGLSFSLRTEVDNNRGPGIRLHVSSGPPHAIAGPGFVGTTADVEQTVYKGYSYTGVIATVALLGDRRPFHAIPSNDELTDTDVVTRRVIRIEHTTLQHVHIAAATVVGLTSSGDVLASNGGVLRDPTAILRALAILAAESWTKPTRRVDLHTSRVLSPIDVGHVIATVDGETTAATVVEVRINAPTSDEGQIAHSVTTQITAAGQRVDLMQLLRPPPVREPK